MQLDMSDIRSVYEDGKYVDYAWDCNSKQWIEIKK